MSTDFSWAGPSQDAEIRARNPRESDRAQTVRADPSGRANGAVTARLS
jgi:hypothetical protein